MIPDSQTLGKITDFYFDYLVGQKPLSEIPKLIAERLDISLEDASHGVGVIILFIKKSIERSHQISQRGESSEVQAKADIISEAQMFPVSAAIRIFDYGSWCVSKGA